MASGGDLPVRGLRHPLSVDERVAGVDLGEQLGGVEPSGLGREPTG